MTRRDDRTRRLKPEEAHLWRKVAASVTPLGPAPQATARHPAAAGPPLEVSNPKRPIPKAAHKAGASKSPSKPEQMAQSPAMGRPMNLAQAKALAEPPPLTGLDRGLSRRLARGRIEIDAQLDLHGYRQEAAYGALQAFLTQARAQGARCALVITGKGAGQTGHTLHGHRHYHTPERTSVLRAQVPLWLEEAAFRVHVAGYQPAHPRHGGGGAFYVWLRRRRH